MSTLLSNSAAPTSHTSACGASKPLVSIIIPLYNSMPYLRECLASVQAQRYTNFEVLCIDDASPDDARAYVELLQRSDPRVKLLNSTNSDQQKNLGPGCARNVGLLHAQGTYIYCLDSDDILHARMLETCVRTLQRTNADMLLFNFTTYNQRGACELEVQWGMPYRNELPCDARTCFTWDTCPDVFFQCVKNVPWNKMLHKRLIERSRVRFQQLYLTEDMMYSLTSAVCATHIVRSAQPLLAHREFSGTNAMSDKGKHPLDVIGAFTQLYQWLTLHKHYEALRVSFIAWLAEALYYNLPAYRHSDDFARACAALAEFLHAIPEDDIRAARDCAYHTSVSAVLDALLDVFYCNGSIRHSFSDREWLRFLLHVTNCAVQEVDSKVCEFQVEANALVKLLRRVRLALHKRGLAL